MAMEKRTSISRQAGNDSVGVEAVGPQVVPWPRRNPPHRLTQEETAPRAVLARPSRTGTSHLAGAGGWAAGDSRGRRYSRGGALPPWPVHRSRRWSSPGRWSGASRRVRPQRPRPGPTTGGSRGRVDGHAPTGSCAGRSPGCGALTTQPRTPTVPPARSASASSMQSPPAKRGSDRASILSPVYRPNRGRASRGKLMVTSPRNRPRCLARVCFTSRPALATRLMFVKL